jgi:hypothetical protein
MVNVSCSENRTTVIKRAMLACEKSGHHIDDDFAIQTYRQEQLNLSNSRRLNNNKTSVDKNNYSLQRFMYS